MTSRGTCCPGVPENPGSEVWGTTLQLTVAGDGSVSGTGDALATEPATFAIQPDIPPCTEIPVTIEGEFSANRGFAIRLFPPEAIESCVQAGFFANWIRGNGIDPPTQRIPLTSPGVAEGEVTVSETGGLKPGTSKNTFHLECTNC